MSKVPTEEELLTKLAGDLETPMADLKEELEKMVEEVKKDEKFQGLEEHAIRTVARNRFVARIRRESSVKGLCWWEGIVLGIGDSVDTVAKLKRLTDAAFKADMVKTTQGWTYADIPVLADNEGRALYPKTENNIKWRRAGKPLPEHSWLRNLIAIATPIDPKTKEKGVPKVTHITANNELAIKANKAPMNKWVKIKMINKTTDEDKKNEVYRASLSAFTKFEEIPTGKLPSIEDVLRSIPDKYKTLAEIEEYHLKNQNDPTRWIITEGNVVPPFNGIPIESTGNIPMTLDDESLAFAPIKEGERTGITVWVPSDRGILIDFAAESRVLVVGRTSQGKKKDPVTGQKTDELGAVGINAWNVYAPELFKIRAEVKALTESSLTPEGSKEESGESEW